MNLNIPGACRDSNFDESMTGPYSHNRLRTAMEALAARQERLQKSLDDLIVRLRNLKTVVEQMIKDLRDMTKSIEDKFDLLRKNIQDSRCSVQASSVPSRHRESRRTSSSPTAPKRKTAAADHARHLGTTFFAPKTVASMMPDDREAMVAPRFQQSSANTRHSLQWASSRQPASPSWQQLSRSPNPVDRRTCKKCGTTLASRNALFNHVYSNECKSTARHHGNSETLSIVNPNHGSQKAVSPSSFSAFAVHNMEKKSSYSLLQPLRQPRGPGDSLSSFSGRPLPYDKARDRPLRATFSHGRKCSLSSSASLSSTKSFFSAKSLELSAPVSLSKTHEDVGSTSHCPGDGSCSRFSFSSSFLEPLKNSEPTKTSSTSSSSTKPLQAKPSFSEPSLPSKAQPVFPETPPVGTQEAVRSICDKKAGLSFRGPSSSFNPGGNSTESPSFNGSASTSFHRCRACGRTFDSRNRLFQHIRTENHTRRRPSSPAESSRQTSSIPSAPNIGGNPMFQISRLVEALGRAMASMASSPEQCLALPVASRS